MGKELRFSSHCKDRIKERGIDEKMVRKSVFTPEQRISKGKRIILHKRYRDPGKNKEYLLRIFVEEKKEEIEIVSVYRTSKIQKYWREKI
ncbi:MAG: DUF4258 domain-containing protein [Candidatus Omnitrophica bacterium]|nr:DUF4258 domain-containing protein [Candidatus Omnitrophota bacterium]MBU0896855.1 DUF4258 domain-containing protein [Candidatus Omnitrophota bacterium]MBU1810153.1 DUF4258 domain-containing protein [Candidatus Omnitrophota bacterium]MBU2436467.1 DUF4258 domain-containing protein [Candidatus Omnitrophota bacterium]